MSTFYSGQWAGKRREKKFNVLLCIVHTLLEHYFVMEYVSTCAVQVLYWVNMASYRAIKPLCPAAAQARASSTGNDYNTTQQISGYTDSVRKDIICPVFCLLINHFTLQGNQYNGTTQSQETLNIKRHKGRIYCTLLYHNRLDQCIFKKKKHYMLNFFFI